MPAPKPFVCPRCGAGLHRIHRTWLDRFISRFVQVRRYRCANAGCNWQGLRRGRGRPGERRRRSAEERG